MAKGTQVLYISGPAMWAKVYDFQKDPEYDNFQITVAPDEASMIALKTAGSRLEGKTDEEGKTWFKFRRPNKKEFRPGEVEILGPPRVVTMKDGEPVPFTENIGNGSEVTIKVVVYPSRKGPGTRLEAVCVDKHIPYEAKEANPGGYAF